MTEAQEDANPRRHLGLIGIFAIKWFWDIGLLIEAGAGFSRPKLGIVLMLPLVCTYLWRGRNWALNLSGVICLFWLAFVAASLLGPLVSVSGEVSRAFPWSNLVAIPAFAYVMKHLQH